MYDDDNNNENPNKTNEDIEVINGDGTDLDISPVYDHIKIDKPDNTTDKKQQIVIPERKNNSNSNKD